MNNNNVLLDVLDELRKEQAEQKQKAAEEAAEKEAEERSQRLAARERDKREMEARSEAERLRREALREHYRGVTKSAPPAADSPKEPEQLDEPVLPSAPRVRSIFEHEDEDALKRKYLTVMLTLPIVVLGGVVAINMREPPPPPPVEEPVVAVVPVAATTAPPTVAVMELKAEPLPAPQLPSVPTSQVRSRVKKAAPVTAAAKIQVDLSAE